MSLLNIARRIIFWSLDFLKGSPIRNHYNEINQILSNTNSKKSIERRNELLNNLLNHAVDTTPFYIAYKKYSSIKDFPIIKKTLIQNNFNSFKSVTYKNKKQFKVSTSGSTGVPFFLFQDKNKRQRNKADLIYFSKLCNYKIGDRLIELEVWREHNKKNKIKSWMQNVLQFDVTKLTDTRIILFLTVLKKTKERMTILGFASSYETICQYLDKNNISLKNLNLSSIIASSEYLNDYTRSNLKSYFNVPILSRYSNEEMGIIAHQTIYSSDYFVINHASYNVEILDLEKDKPAKLGKLGRIVVTDLFNFYMPMIRYDTGDIARLFKEENGITKFEHIEGRKMDSIYDTQGNLISSFIVYTKFYKYYHLLKQYQFIQESENEYTIKLNIYDDFSFEKELIEDVKNDFGKDAKIKIVYVDDIPNLSSGKRKKVLNLWYTNKKNS